MEKDQSKFQMGKGWGHAHSDPWKGTHIWEILTVKQCQVQDPEISISPLLLLSILYPDLLLSPKPALSFG